MVKTQTQTDTGRRLWSLYIHITNITVDKGSEIKLGFVVETNFLCRTELV